VKKVLHQTDRHVLGRRGWTPRPPVLRRPACRRLLFGGAARAGAAGSPSGSSGSRIPRARDAAQELVAAILEMHGAGLATIGASSTRPGRRGGAKAKPGRRPGRRQPAADPRSLPVPLSSGSAKRSRKSGPTWNPTTATSSCSASEDGGGAAAAGRELRRLPGLGVDPGAGDQGGAGEGGPDLTGLEVEGLVEERPPPSGVELPVDPERQRGHGPGQRQRGRRRAAAGSSLPAGFRSTRQTARRGRSPGSRSAAWRSLLPTSASLCSPSVTAVPPAVSRSPPATSRAAVLDCPSCERRFYLPRAGRSMDEERLLLEPVPLLESGGAVTVAVGG